MPFPLAHPAAILPLRRFSPRWLDFPALVIGSLAPDLSYAVGVVQLDHFAHHLLGTIAFSLPVGLLAVGFFYLVRTPMLGMVPARYRELYAAACRRKPAPLAGIILSLLLGAWSHILLDSLSHRDGWIVQHLPVMEKSIGTFAHHEATLYQVAWFGFTFIGVTWLALAYLKWLQTTANKSFTLRAHTCWALALGASGMTILLALAHRLMRQWYELYPIALCMVVIALAFAAVTARLATRNMSAESESPC